MSAGGATHRLGCQFSIHRRIAGQPALGQAGAYDEPAGVHRLDVARAIPFTASVSVNLARRNAFAMELDSAIDVRIYEDVSLIRYRAQIEIEVQGQKYPRASYWFSDAYEKRDGQWQIVWSQGTGIA